MDYDELLPYVLPDVPGCSEPLAIQSIRTAVIRFCEEAKILKRTLAAVPLIVDEPRYEIIAPTGYDWADVTFVLIDGKPIVGTSEDYMGLAWQDAGEWQRVFTSWQGCCCDGRSEGWREGKQQRPQAYYIDRDGGDFIRLVGIPTEGSDAFTLQLKLALKPTFNSTAVEDFVISDYFEILAQGALARLLAMPKKQWSDLNAAAINATKYNDGVGTVRNDALRSFVRDDQAIGRVTSHP